MPSISLTPEPLAPFPNWPDGVSDERGSYFNVKEDALNLRETEPTFRHRCIVRLSASFTAHRQEAGKRRRAYTNAKGRETRVSEAKPCQTAPNVAPDLYHPAAFPTVWPA